MPWTFAHPAAVLPLRGVLRGRLSFCAMVIGSLTPDLGFYFGSYVLSSLAHTFWGLLTVCLPSGLALLVITGALHRPVAGLLPFPHRQRLLSVAPVRSLRTLSAFLWASISVLLGGLTHVLWDGFTHENGDFVVRWPYLHEIFLRIGRKELPLYEVLQDAGSLLGAAIVVVAYLRWVRGGQLPREPQAQADDRWRYRVLASVVVGAMLIAAPPAYYVYKILHGGRNPVLFAVRFLVYGTTAFFLLLIVAATAWRQRAERG